jgi:hypothetical protein
MSGNAFKEHKIILADRNHYVNVKHVLQKWFDQVSPVGSTQFFDCGGFREDQSPKNDLDFAVSATKEEIIEIVSNNPYVKSYKKFGNTISTLWETSSGLIHIDLMASKNVFHEAWIMTGGSPRIKGVMRNVLLCFLARKKSEAEGVKWTVAFPGGIGKKENKICLERKTKPSLILKTLNISCHSADVENTRTFEGLSLMINWDEQMIQEFQEYARAQWLYKKQPEVIDNGLSYLLEQH